MSTGTFRNRYLIVYKSCKLLNYLPVFNLSVDQNFGTMNLNGKLRASLICLFLGDRLWYFFTYYDSKISLFKSLKLPDVLRPYSMEKWREDAAKFDSFDSFDIAMSDEYPIYKEFLQSETAELDRSLGTSNGKVNTYLTALSIIAGFFLFSFKSMMGVINIQTPIVHTALLYGLSGLLIMHLVGLGMLIRYYLAVKSYTRPSFQDIREEATPLKHTQLLYQSYRAKAEYARHQTTIVLNIQPYFWKSVVLAALLFTTTSILSQKNSSPDNTVSSVVLQNESGLIYVDALAKLAESHTRA